MTRLFRRLILLLLIAAAPIAPSAARDAEPIDRRDFTCPLGGQRFTQEVGYSAFALITLPDGSWLGDPLMDVQIPRCPENGLVILPDFAAMQANASDRMIYGVYDAAERARLPALVADPAYRALAPDNRYAQAYWLATQLGRPASLRFHLLQRSSWATTDPALRQRRVAAFAADAPALVEAMDDPPAAKRANLLYVVNALRELGRFDAALALLDRIEADGPVPGVASPDEMFAPESAGPAMRAVIVAGDDDRYPVELLDRRMANDKCSGAVQYPPYDQRTTKTEAACARRKASADAEEAAFGEAMRIGEDPAERDRLCAATPEDRRSAGLAQACDFAKSDRDEAEGRALAMQGQGTAARCEATPENERDGPLRFACVSYDILVESRLGRMLAADEDAYAILCGGDGEHDYPDRDARVGLACQSASRDRTDRAVEKLLEDGAALDARCASVGDDETDVALYIACSNREKARQGARIEKLATDDAAYRRECARFGDKARDLLAGDASETEIVCDHARYRRNHPQDTGKGWTVYAPLDTIDVEEADPATNAAVAAAGEAAEAARAALVEMNPALRDGSGLDVAAHAAATSIIATAKAEKTYPRRPEGQLD